MRERERNQEHHIPSGVRERFTILHAGWELDNVGWIANDGRVYTTSHGSAPFPMSMDELKAKIEETTKSLHGLVRALEALDEAQEGELE
ncbi:MAG: hypothetical protein OXH72_12560 [Caldilineaceae bacterium]|nr:hypothetical protein [Caldilineaceae bacterium]